MLTLDHVILRTPDAEAALAVLAERTDAPVLAEPERVNGIRSAIVRAGPIDIELLEIGAQPPEHTHGYGLGFVADRPLDEAVDVLRGLGFATSAPVRGIAGRGPARRSWRAVQVHGLLPDAFPVATTTRPFGGRDRFAEGLGSFLVRIPGMASAATRKPGASMVVITEYEFDAAAWRHAHAPGPVACRVTVGAGEHRHRWSDLPLSDSGLIDLRGSGAEGVARVEFEDGGHIDLSPTGGMRIASGRGASRVGFDGPGDVHS